MKVEIDQSGKVERLNTHTVIGLSNDTQLALYITSPEKIKLVKALRKSVIPKNDFNALIFSIFVFILLKLTKKRLGSIFIDIEYTGKNDLIGHTIENLASNFKIQIPLIKFKLIGKSSKAHELVYKIYKNKDKKRAKMIRSEEVLKYFKV